MSEHFERLQHQLRQIKEASGVDFTDPRGVSIFGKLHPARNKFITLDGNQNKSVGKGGWFEVEIPFENGTHANVSGTLYDKWKENKEKGISHLNDAIHTASAGHAIPAIFDRHGILKYANDEFTTHANGVYWQGDSHYIEPVHPKNPGYKTSYVTGNVSELINDHFKKWSQEPFKGTYYEMRGKVHPDTGLPPRRDMTEEELQEHRQKATHKPLWNPENSFVRPHLIGVRPDFDSNLNNHYVYNIQTEELHDTGVPHGF